MYCHVYKSGGIMDGFFPTRILNPRMSISCRGNPPATFCHPIGLGNLAIVTDSNRWFLHWQWIRSIPLRQKTSLEFFGVFLTRYKTEVVAWGMWAFIVIEKISRRNYGLFHCTFRQCFFLKLHDMLLHLRSLHFCFGRSTNSIGI